MRAAFFLTNRPNHLLTKLPKDIELLGCSIKQADANSVQLAFKVKHESLADVAEGSVIPTIDADAENVRTEHCGVCCKDVISWGLGSLLDCRNCNTPGFMEAISESIKDEANQNPHETWRDRPPLF